MKGNIFDKIRKASNKYIEYMLAKNQVEYVQKKQHEYKLTDKKKKIPGHILFSFNLKTKEIKRVSITNEVSIVLNGKPIMKNKVVLGTEAL